MTPKTIDDYDIVAFYLAFSTGKGGKRRPILIVKSGDNLIDFMPITSKYNHKSPQIKRQYYPIQDWQSAGLLKPSYIDIGALSRARLSDFHELGEIRLIGQLSRTDILGLDSFITSYLRKNTHPDFH